MVAATTHRFPIPLIDIDESPYAKRAKRFSAEGGRKSKRKGGSAVKDDRRGGAPGLHKRGSGSAEDWGGSRRGRMARSLTARGIHPLYLCFTREGERGHLPSTGPQRSEARKHSVARMADVPKGSERWNRFKPFGFDAMGPSPCNARR